MISEKLLTMSLPRAASTNLSSLPSPVARRLTPAVAVTCIISSLASGFDELQRSWRLNLNNPRLLTLEVGLNLNLVKGFFMSPC